MTYPKYEIKYHQETLHAGHSGDSLQLFAHFVVLWEDNFRKAIFL